MTRHNLPTCTVPKSQDNTQQTLICRICAFKRHTYWATSYY